MIQLYQQPINDKGMGERAQHPKNALRCLTCMTKQTHCFVLINEIFKKCIITKLKDVVVYLFFGVRFL